MNCGHGGQRLTADAPARADRAAGRDPLTPEADRSNVDGLHQAARADALLVVGSSPMIYSGYRFAQTAVAPGMRIAAVNLGRTRADSLLTLKVNRLCTESLAGL